jgi:MATE family multidrug resistance protein
VAQYRRELDAQIRLAVPLAIGHLGHQVLGLVDTVMLGHYSETALAASGVGNSLLFVVTVLGIGIVMGLDTLVPQALGANEPERARRLLWQGVWMSVIVGVPLCGVTVAMPLLLPLAGVESAVSEEAARYVLGRMPAIVPTLLFVACRSYLQAKNVTVPIVIAMVLSNVVNVALDGLLIFGDGGLEAVGLPAIGAPELGAFGAAIGSTIVSVISLAIVALAVRMVHDTPPSSRGFDRALFGAIARLGGPIGLQLVAEVGIFALTTVLAARLGTIPAAAHQIALSLASFMFSAIMGIGAATSVRVGRAVGAGDTAGARAAGLAGVGLGAAAMSISAIAFVAFAPNLARMFTSDTVVIDAAVPLLMIAAVFQLSDGIQGVTAGALRGAGDTKSALYANIFGHYAVGLWLAIGLGFGLGYGAPGLWWGLSAGLSVVAVILIWRFLWLTSRPIARS